MKVTYNITGILSSPAKLDWIGQHGEDLLRQAGLKKYWDDPVLGQRVFEVDKMPEDATATGIYWVEVFPKGTGTTE